MKFIKNGWAANLVIILILVTGSWLRASWYGDLRLSIANAETDSYINSSRAPVFSWQIFAGQRLFTTNLIFKMANDAADCPITSYGQPGLGKEDFRRVQPCFDKIALLQNFLSIIGWAFLAWMVAKQLKNPLIKIIAASVIIIFGFTPQIAEWDSVLSPESLSLSMFAITLGIALELVLHAANSETPLRTGREKLLLAALIVFFLLWVFVRDVHLYAIPVILVLLVPLFFINKIRESKTLPIVFAVLLFFFVIGYTSARDSLRATRFPLMNSLDEYIWPHPARVDFFKQYGMPEKDDPDYKKAPIYQAWADEHAAKAYAMFLVTHPGFVVTTLWENLDQISSDFVQPYFFTPEVKNREFLLNIGTILHPETPSVYLIGSFLLLAFIIHSIQLRTPAISAWAWLAVFVVGTASATLFISYFGDIAGLRRHIMPSVEMFRLFIWIFMMPFLDLSHKQKEQAN